MSADEQDWLAALAARQQTLWALVGGLPEQALRTQYHPELSPLGWHLGHCAFVETFWTRERLDDDDRHTRPWQALFAAERSPKDSRGGRLPALPELRRWCAERHADTLERLTAGGDHPLLRGQYLTRFLLQHHAQHLETMRMVLVERHLREPARPIALGTGQPAGAAVMAQPERAAASRVRLPAGRYRIGSDDVYAYDNEKPAQELELAAVDFAARPASNADYLAFMAADGYAQECYWSESGWAWRQSLDRPQPHGWQRAPEGWQEATPHGPAPLTPSAPAKGLSHHEAAAYARWAGGRLPHEYEWEAALRLNLLEHAGEVWEWCANTFHPYPGFRAHPYEGYSLPWFDGQHLALRGGSRHSDEVIRRPSFRNFHTAGKRHLFAGVRVAYDG